MIATESYIDASGRVVIEGQPLQFARRPQNLKAKPSRHRRQEPINQQAYIRSFADAAGAIITLMLFATAVAGFLAWINY